MPLYDYQCEQCQRHTEKIQKFSDAPLTECPHCGGHLERVLHAPAVAFKGGGWYADGYGNKKSGASGETKSGDTKAGESKSDSAAAKPAGDSAAAKSSGDSSSSTSTSAPAAATSSTSASTPAASSSSGSDKK